MNEIVHALAIVAHPDDESFLLAGTSLKFAEEGKAVGVICVTRGEKGEDRLKRNLSEEQMAEIRLQELSKACSILKCKCTEHFDHPDGGLDQVNFDDLVKELKTKIEEHQPKIILTFGPEGISGHRDHMIVGKAALIAADQANPKPREAWLMSMPASAIDIFNEHQAKRRVHHSHYEKTMVALFFPRKCLGKRNWHTQLRKPGTVFMF
jgi:LmbE family N-acetylglucosaminyl deacetylase